MVNHTPDDQFCCLGLGALEGELVDVPRHEPMPRHALGPLHVVGAIAEDVSGIRAGPRGHGDLGEEERIVDVHIRILFLTIHCLSR